MKLAERHRLNPRPKKKVVDPNVRRRGPNVLYLNKSVYESSSTERPKEYSDLFKYVNDTHGLKLSDDVDMFISEIFKRGWKIASVDIPKTGNHKIRVLRSVGGTRSRSYTESASTFKTALLLALDRVLSEESSRFTKRVSRERKLVLRPGVKENQHE